MSNWFSVLKTEVFDPNENGDDFCRFKDTEVEFMNWNKCLRYFLTYKLPVILWTAEPMISHNTGMREKGESAKINGVWWRLKSWNTDDLSDEFRFRNDLSSPLKNHTVNSAFSKSHYPIVTSEYLRRLQDSNIESKAESVGSLLSKALDAAIREGWTPDQIMSLVNARIVITTMED